MLINSNKFMSLKSYQKWKMAIVFVLALSISQSIVRGNFIIPMILMIVCSLLLWYLRSQLKEVLADERDYATAGRAALLAIQIFGWLGAVSMLALYAQRSINPSYEIIASTLSYSVLFLFLVYGLIFHYYNKFKFKKNLIYLFVAILNYHDCDHL